MMIQENITKYFPRYSNPVVFPEIQQGIPLPIDNFVVRMKDIDNDGSLELLVMYGGKIKVSSKAKSKVEELAREPPSTISTNENGSRLGLR
jgi:hypothetical protein